MDVCGEDENSGLDTGPHYHTFVRIEDGHVEEKSCRTSTHKNLII